MTLIASLAAAAKPPGTGIRQTGAWMLLGLLIGFGLGVFVNARVHSPHSSLEDARHAFTQNEYEQALHVGLKNPATSDAADAAESRRFLLAALARLPRITFPLDRSQRQAAYSADGRWLLLSGWTRHASLHDARTGIEVPWLAERPVIEVQFTPDGRHVLARTEDGVELWDVTNGERHGWFASGEMADIALATPDGSRVITIGRRYIRAWAVDSGRESLRIETSGMDAAQLSDDGHWLASVPGLGDGQDVRIYDMRTARQVAAFPIEEGHLSVAWRPGKPQVAVGSSAHIEIFEVPSGRCVLRLPQRETRRLAFSPDGAGLAVATGDRQIHTWSIDEGKLQHTLPHPAGAASLAFSPDGRWLLTGGTETIDDDGREIRDFRVRLWRMHDGALHQSARLRGEVTDVAFRPGAEEFIAVADSATAKVFALDDGLEGRDLRDYAAARDVLLHGADGAEWRSAPRWKTRESKAANDCDRLAAHPLDAQRLARGLPEPAIPAGRARDACEAALLAYPDEPRVRYQLGRALAAWGNPALALGHTRRAADMGYPRAQGALAESLLAQDIPERRAEGMEWQRRAAKGGDPPAMLAMAELSPSAEHADDSIARAAAAGLPAAHAALALRAEHAYLTDGQPADLARAFHGHALTARLAALDGEWALATRSALRRASLAAVMPPAQVISLFRESMRWTPSWAPPDAR